MNRGLPKTRQQRRRGIARFEFTPPARRGCARALDNNATASAMLIPPNDSVHFLRVYKEILERTAGTPLKTAKEYADARNKYFESEPSARVPSEDENLARALATASFGTFTVARHLVRSTVMLGPGDRVYRVAGITTELKELMPAWTLVQTAVMNFNGHWICDGLINSFNVHIGPQMRRDIREKIRYADQIVPAD